MTNGTAPEDTPPDFSQQVHQLDHLLDDLSNLIRALEALVPPSEEESLSLEKLAEDLQERLAGIYQRIEGMEITLNSLTETQATVEKTLESMQKTLRTVSRQQATLNSALGL